MSSRKHKIERIKALIEGKSSETWTESLARVNEAKKLGIPIEDLGGGSVETVEWQECEAIIMARRRAREAEEAIDRAAVYVEPGEGGATKH